MKILVNSHTILLDKTPVNELELNVTKCEFEFAEEITNDFVKEAYFTLDNGNTYKKIIVNNECDIPGEVLEKKGGIELGVVAYLVENETEIKRYNPSPAYFDTWLGSLRDAENSEPITPSEMEQYEQALQDGLAEVNDKLDEIDQALDDVTTAIEETNNLDLDVSKEGKTATVTLTKKDATTKVVTLSDGTSLMFNWDGTSLGIKTDEDENYTYVDLQGVQGPIGPKGEAFTIKKTYSSVAEMNADFNNMQLGDYVMIASTVEIEDNAKLYTRGENQWIFISDFSGATGIKGETGTTPNIQIGTVTSGTTPSVTRSGTNENPVLNFVLEKGDKGDTGQTGQTGATGNGIASITKTGTSGLVDTYTITYTDGTTSTFEVTNGQDGEVTQEQLDETNEEVERAKMVYNALPKVTGTGTEVTLNDTANCPMPMSLKPSATSQDGTPTPENPQDIHTVSGNNTIEVSNLNKLNPQSIRITSGAGAKSVDSEGYVTAINTTSDSRTWNYAGRDYQLTLKAGTYTILVETVAISSSGGVRVYTRDDTLLTSSIYDALRTIGNHTETFTLTNETTIGIISKLYTSKVRFSILSKGTEYVPYEVKSLPLNLGTIELCKIDDYEDYFYKDSGKWYLHKEIEKVVLNGTESYTYDSTYTRFYTQLSFNYNTSVRSQFPCNLYTNGDSTTSGHFGTNAGGKLLYFFTPNSNITTTTDFKNWVSSNNLIIYVVLATPTNTEITDTTLISQLEAIYNKATSYQDQTNITQVNNDLPFVITATGIRDLSNIFDLISGTEL